jgi:Gram-negative bacterial TonB protein C-terminal
MKKNYILLAIFLFATFSFAQEAKKDDWIRVQSDDGEFSIEVPAKYGYFFDKEGTMISDGGGNRYGLSEMNVLNVYFEHTLLSFETYEAENRCLDLIEDANETSAKWQKATDKKSEIKEIGYKIKQHVSKNDTQYTVRRYFRSKKYIYILTASSRSGETAIMKRFFDSLVFKPDVDSKIRSGDSRFPDMKVTPIIYEEKFETSEKNDKPPVSAKLSTPDPTLKNLLIVSQPSASFTNTARQNNEQGVVRIKVTFSASGQITHITGLQTLRFGLYRNALFAALRIKYLPQEKDDKPMSVAKTIEYRFSLG